MPKWPPPTRRLAAGIGVCVALVLVVSSCASDAVPGRGGPHFTGESGAVEPGTVSTGAEVAVAQPAEPLPETGPAASQPAAEETTVEPAPDPDPSPPPSTSAPPIEPAATEAPAEDPADTSTPESQDVESPLSSTDSDSSVPLVEEPEPAEPPTEEPGTAEPEDAEAEPATPEPETPETDAETPEAEPGTPEPETPEPEDPETPEAEVETTGGSDEQSSDDAPPESEDEQAEGDDEPSYDRVWVVDDAGYAAASDAAADQTGVGVVAATSDLRALPRSARKAIAGASEVEVLSDLGEDAAWQLEAIRRGEELPGGGLLLFGPSDDSPGRRMVAAYGHPSTGALGVLGEQGPEAAVERLRAISEGYGADGLAVLPTFEIIATVASASAGTDGDYSSTTDREAIRPWIETAAANGVYVVLDLQPGRSDFLSQAKKYEEFLRLPHVGLALDPEWRLKPDQVHLAQIGTVDAAEINRVVDWLAGIVREKALPQKLLILHQFRVSMITNREQIKTPAELAVLIHMDGQGSLAAKYNTWNMLTGLPDADRFHWGWKNFYDEDNPMATPEQVLARSPKIVFVSFQ